MNTKLLKTIFSIFVLAFVSSCASSAKISGMTTNTAQIGNFGSYKNSIAVSNISGGNETNPLWMSKVSNNDFTQALKLSLSKNGLLNEINPNYILSANLGELSQPMFGLDMSVGSKVSYSIADKKTNKVVLNKDVANNYTAKFGDAFSGVERLRLANEGAIRENIEQFIASLKK
jgi:hypothetical protein